MSLRSSSSPSAGDPVAYAHSSHEAGVKKGLWCPGTCRCIRYCLLFFFFFFTFGLDWADFSFERLQVLFFCLKRTFHLTLKPQPDHKDGNDCTYTKRKTKKTKVKRNSLQNSLLHFFFFLFSTKFWTLFILKQPHKNEVTFRNVKGTWVAGWISIAKSWTAKSTTHPDPGVWPAQGRADLSDNRSRSQITERALIICCKQSRHRPTTHRASEEFQLALDWNVKGRGKIIVISVVTRRTSRVSALSTADWKRQSQTL